MFFIASPAKWMGQAAAVAALVAVAALPVVVTAAAAAQQGGGPAPEPGVPLARTAQPAPPAETGADATPATQNATSHPATQPSGGDAAAEAHASYQEPVLGERLAELAQNRLREPVVTEAMWRQAAALLEAATRTNPREPRFHRLLVEARLKTGDTDGAIRALSAYRKVDPTDQVAQIQLIDLYVGAMQTADARLEYLRDVLRRSSVVPAVRAHAAALCVPLLLERSREEAMSMLDEALRLFPLSPEALRLRYGMMDASTTPPQRCAVLLSLLRSNPAQPEVIDQLGDLLAGVGMTRDAVEWYSVALRLYPHLGRDYPEGFISDLGSQLLLAGQHESLETLLASYLKARPDDADAWFMRLIKEKAAGEKGNAKAIDDARQGLTTHWSNVADRIAGREPQPQPQPQPDPAAPGAFAAPGAGLPAPVAAAPAAPAADPAEVVKRVKSGEADEWKNEFVAAASDLAWLELFFAEKPDAAAKWVNAVKEVLPPESVTVARLDGWLDLLQNRPDDSKSKLSKIAGGDPLAALGMVRLAGSDAKAQAEADEVATRLLAEYPTGLVSAMVRTGLGSRATKPAMAPAAAEVAAELQKFPRDWMEILNKPTAYYKISADVMKVAHRYGEPLLGRVMLQNISSHDLTIGPEGVLRPDLWFDAKLGGLANQAFPGVAYDRIARVVVLPAGQGVGQIVRLDQGALGQALAANPSVSTQVIATVVTNPASSQGGVAPGPAGERQSFKALSRAGFPLSQTAQRKRVMTALESGTPGEKFRNLDLLAAYIQLLAAAKDMDEATRTAGTEFASALTRSREDSVPAVSAYATYLTARLSSPDARGEFVDRLLANENWPARLLGLIASGGLGTDREIALAERLAKSDPEPTLKAFAAATAEALRNPPATRPTTQPGQPAPTPGTPAPAGPGIGAGDASPLPSGLSVPSKADGPAKRAN